MEEGAETEAPQAPPVSTPVSNSTMLSSVPSIDSMPDEIILMVFSHLSPNCLLRNVALVSKKWYELAMDKSIWRRQTAWFHWGEPWKFRVSQVVPLF